MKRIVVCVNVVIAAPLLAGCTSHAPRKTVSPTTVHTTPTGSSLPTVPLCSHEGVGVSGTLRMVGGPSNAANEPVPGTVTIQGLSGSCTLAVGPSGNFTTPLAPGRYRVTGRSPDYDGGRADCVAEHDVVVQARPRGGHGPPVPVIYVDCQRE